MIKLSVLYSSPPVPHVVSSHGKCLICIYVDVWSDQVATALWDYRDEAGGAIVVGLLLDYVQGIIREFYNKIHMLKYD